MKTYRRLFQKLCSIENLEEAYWKARKRKSNNPKIKEFENHAQLHLAILHRELWTKTYTPRPLKKFILRDPKTRTIYVSDFRDRIVHHALINILQPIFEPLFIHDSYASRKGKGTLAAVRRFEDFSRKVRRNGVRNGYVLKADIRHYFESIDHCTLLAIIRKKIKDDSVLWLVNLILSSAADAKGMPLGNWTSQFFANVYLNELDQYVKHRLKSKYYIRYVDDFVILRESKSELEAQKCVLELFLRSIGLDLHPDKCKILHLERGVDFLGYRIFPNHKLLRRRSVRKLYAQLNAMRADEIDDGIRCLLSGWHGYAKHANTYSLREKMHQYAFMRPKSINTHFT